MVAPHLDILGLMPLIRAEPVVRDACHPVVALLANQCQLWMQSFIDEFSPHVKMCPSQQLTCVLQPTGRPNYWSLATGPKDDCRLLLWDKRNSYFIFRDLNGFARAVEHEAPKILLYKKGSTYSISDPNPSPSLVKKLEKTQVQPSTSISPTSTSTSTPKLVPGCVPSEICARADPPRVPSVKRAPAVDPMGRWEELGRKRNAAKRVNKQVSKESCVKKRKKRGCRPLSTTQHHYHRRREHRRQTSPPPVESQAPNQGLTYPGGADADRFKTADNIVCTDMPACDLVQTQHVQVKYQVDLKDLDGGYSSC